MATSCIRVLLVEDSPVALTILRRLLADTPEIEVVGEAHNGLEALEMVPALQPHVICTDLHMPKMSGLELIRRIMAEFPRPILVISASVQEEDTKNVFQLLQAGALDIFPKPRSGLASEYEQTKVDLINRIKVLSGVSVFTQRYRSQPSKAPILKSQSARSQGVMAPAPVGVPVDIRLPRIVAIGSSTGGPQALYTILKQIPPSFPVPIVCVQHISEGFLQGLVDWLGMECPLRVAIAQSGEMPRAGTVYFAPERHHLEFDAQGRFVTMNSVPVAGHCPSVTMLFQSVAAYYRRSSVGILLTGMGRDGADGLLTINREGGITIAQDEQSCVVFGMPREAIALGAAKYILPLNEIAPTLLTRVFSTVKSS